MTHGNAWLVVGLACSALVSGLGCGDDDATTTDSGTADAGPDAGPELDAVLHVATFNAGLLDTVGYVPERQPLVTDALAELDADVLCVQEVWDDAHWDALVEANAGTRPHTLRLEAMPGVAGQCTPAELLPLRECSETMCPDPTPSDFATCTIAMCSDLVGALSSSCSACLLDHSASGDLDLIEEMCLGSDVPEEDLPLPPEERAYLLGGAFGIGILSKLPLIETDTMVLDASTTRRGIVYAKIDVPELGEVDVFCTHLTAVLPELRYEGSYDTWEGENAAHVQALIDWVDDKTGGDSKVIALGDFNTGPAQPEDGIEPEVAMSYELLPAADFADPFLDGSSAACTFCSENPLVRAEDTGVDANLDHVMTRGFDSTVTVDRILDGLVSIDRDDDAGAPEELPLSDHYGLEATFFE